MGAHMKKRILPVIIAILLILVIAGGALGKVLLDKYGTNFIRCQRVTEVPLFYRTKW